MVSEPVTNQISSFLYENCESITPENLIESLPTLVKMAAAIVGINVEELAAEGEDIIASIVETLAAPIVHIFAVAVSFVILYFLSLLLLSIAFWFVDLLFKKGTLGVLNKILGFVTSLLVAIFIAWGIVSVFEYVIHVPSLADSNFTAEFTGGWVYNLFKRYNPIEILLSF